MGGSLVERESSAHNLYSLSQMTNCANSTV